jgi:hypothetical protein
VSEPLHECKLFDDEVPSAADLDEKLSEVAEREAAQSDLVVGTQEQLHVAMGPVKAKRTMLDLYRDIEIMARVTNTYGWDVDDDKMVMDPQNGAKPICPRQWIEAMRVAVAMYARAGGREVGVPEALAHPVGKAGLTWRKPDGDGHKWFTIQIGPDSREIRFGAEWERHDARGDRKGVSTDLRDLGAALDSVFSDRQD